MGGEEILLTLEYLHPKGIQKKKRKSIAANGGVL